MKIKLYCCGCEKTVTPRLTTGKEIYPHRKDLFSIPFWVCNTCRGYVGCHHKTETPNKPLGNIPTPTLRVVRMKIHKVMKNLMCSGVGKGTIYKKLSEFTKRQYHTAEISSLEEAKRILTYLEGGFND